MPRNTTVPVTVQARGLPLIRLLLGWAMRVACLVVRAPAHRRRIAHTLFAVGYAFLRVRIDRGPWRRFNCSVLAKGRHHAG